MKFHRNDWRRRVFRGELLQQTVKRIDRLKTALRLEPSVSLAQLSLRFCLGHPAVTALIPGVRNCEQARCNLQALELGPLPQETLDQISQLWHEEFCYNVRTSIGEEGEG